MGIVKRNLEIDLYRLLFAFTVVLVHSHGLKPPDPTRYPFCGGYLAVEFFFMLTGYFATRKMECSGNYRMAARQAIIWTWKKFLQLYQYVIPAVILHYFANAWMQKLPAFETVKMLLYGTFEMLLLPASGIYETFQILPLWYLSALLLTLPMFYYMAMRLRDTFFYLISPLSILFIYGYFSVTYGHLDVWSKWTGHFLLALLRSWAGLCLGGLCYLLAERLKKVPFSKEGLLLLRTIKILCLAGSVFYMLTRCRRKLDFLCVGLLFIALVITFSNMQECNRKCGNFLSELSLALYVSHWTIRSIVPVIMPEATYAEMLIPYLLISLIYAGGFAVVVNAVRRLSVAEKLKRYFLLQGYNKSERKEIRK